MARLESRWEIVGGVRIHARASMPRLPAAAASLRDAIVCVHGYGVSSRYFVRLAQALSTTHRVFVPDLPGHGRSATPPVAYDIREHTSALLAWMDAAQLPFATFVANSMGCQIVAELAALAPARASRLVLIAPTIDPGARSAIRQFGRLLRCAPFERPTLVPILAIDYFRMGPRLAPELRALLAHDAEGAYARVRTPTLVMRGAHDAIVPPAWATRVAELVGSAEGVVTLPGLGHAPHHSCPRDVASVVRRFVAEGERAGR